MNKSKQKINLTHAYNLSSVTPIAIGDGNEISPLADYYYNAENKKLFFVQKKKFEEFLLKDKDRIEVYFNKISEVMDTGKNEALLDFLKSQTQLEKPELLVKFFHPIAIPAFGIENAREIATIIKDIDRPYLPGSSIKGVIKTAILYYWLAYSLEGQDKVIEFLNILRGNKRNIEEHYKRNIEEFIFGSLFNMKKGWRMPYSMMKVWDSNSLNMEAVEIHNMNIKYLVPQGEKQSNEDFSVITKECIKFENLSLKISYADNITENRNLGNTYLLPQLKKNQQQLFLILNHFAKDNLQYEMDLLRDRTKVNIRQAEELFEYQEITNELLKKVKNQFKQKEGMNAAYLRVGSGKTHFYNAISLAVLKSNPTFVQLKQYAKHFKARLDKDIFPITRKVTSEKQLPLGWIKIEIK